MLYIILLHGSKYSWPVQFIRSNTIEPAVQLVFNGWTNEPVNRWPHRFNGRPGSNNYGCSMAGPRYGHPWHDAWVLL